MFIRTSMRFLPMVLLFANGISCLLDEEIITPGSKDELISKLSNTTKLVEKPSTSEPKVSLKKDAEQVRNKINKNLMIQSQGVSNSTDEQSDMLGTYVTPHDDDNDTTKNVTVLVLETGNVTLAIHSTPPLIFPVDSNVKSIATASDEDIARLKPTLYETSSPVSSEIPSVTSDATSTVKPQSSTATVNTSSTAKLDNSTASKIRMKPLSTNSEDENYRTSMASGTIALIAALTFVMAVIVTYIGFVLWRKYLEYRYGNRELLVNEFDFDGSDLRHFEL